jgi:hypothetical protein
MKDRIQRYEIHCDKRPDVIARGIEGLGGQLYEVHTNGTIRAGLSELQRTDLEERKLGITIALEDSTE